MASQTENMKSLVDKTVSEALMKKSLDDDLSRGPSQQEIMRNTKEVKMFEDKLKKFE